MKHACLTALLVFALLPPAFGAEVMTFATVDWEPYAGERLPSKGFTSEIIAEACRRAGYEASFVFLPWKRAMAEVESGRFDALYSAYYSEERAAVFGVSAPYISGPLVLCVRAGSALTYDGTLKSLAPYRIGIVSGYVNTPEFDRADFIAKDIALSDLQNLQKLLAGRVDAIVIDKYVAIHHLKTTPTIEAGLSAVRFVSPPLEEKPVYAMFSKKRAGWEKKLQDFNRGLASMVEDKTVQTILRKHGFWVEPGE